MQGDATLCCAARVVVTHGKVRRALLLVEHEGRWQGRQMVGLEWGQGQKEGKEERRQEQMRVLASCCPTQGTSHESAQEGTACAKHSWQARLLHHVPANEVDVAV